jgi:hypothetical protein
MDGFVVLSEVAEAPESKDLHLLFTILATT